MTTLLVRGMLGLGDNIMQRWIVREIVRRHEGHVYLETPWPQLVADLPVRCVARRSKLRTQEKNAARADLVWSGAPADAVVQRIRYTGASGSMLAAMCACVGVSPDALTYDLPTFKRQERRPYIVVRPATVREEFRATARNPQPEYLAMAVDALRNDFDIVSVADLARGREWALPPLPFAHETFHAGELVLEDLLALVQNAAGCIGGVGWIAPACVAYRVPLFIIYGGSGEYDGPQRIFDPRMPTEKVHHAIPDNFCLCNRRDHACDKRISGVAEQVETWAMGLDSRRSAAVVA